MIGEAAGGKSLFITPLSPEPPGKTLGLQSADEGISRGLFYFNGFEKTCLLVILTNSPLIVIQPHSRVKPFSLPFQNWCCGFLASEILCGPVRESNYNKLMTNPIRIYKESRD